MICKRIPDILRSIWSDSIAPKYYQLQLTIDLLTNSEKITKSSAQEYGEKYSI